MALRGSSHLKHNVGLQTIFYREDLTWETENSTKIKIHKFNLCKEVTNLEWEFSVASLIPYTET